MVLYPYSMINICHLAQSLLTKDIFTFNSCHFDRKKSHFTILICIALIPREMNVFCTHWLFVTPLHQVSLCFLFPKLSCCCNLSPFSYGGFVLLNLQTQPKYLNISHIAVLYCTVLKFKQLFSGNKFVKVMTLLLNSPAQRITASETRARATS